MDGQKLLSNFGSEENRFHVGHPFKYHIRLIFNTRTPNTSTDLEMFQLKKKESTNQNTVDKPWLISTFPSNYNLRGELRIQLLV